MQMGIAPLSVPNLRTLVGSFGGLNFKVGLKNSMRGWGLRHVQVSARGLAHVLDMESLDVGLLHEAQAVREECLYKRKAKRRYCAH